MADKREAMRERLSDRLMLLLKQDEDWKIAADEIASMLDVTNADLSSPQEFVNSLSLPLGRLADEAIRREFNPRSVSDPLDLVNNLLPSDHHLD